MTKLKTCALPRTPQDRQPRRYRYRYHCYGCPGYPELAVKNLAELTGIDFKNSEDPIAATSDCGAYMTLSSAIKGLAVKMTKVCNDIRLLASGPRQA